MLTAGRPLPTAKENMLMFRSGDLEARLGRSGVVIVVLSAASLAAAGPAYAGPGVARNPGLAHIRLSCADGTSYQTVTNGNALFSPAHDTASNQVLVPTEFGAATITVTHSDGTTTTTSDPSIDSKQSARRQPGTIACIYTFSFADGLDVVSVTGDVLVFRPGI